MAENQIGTSTNVLKYPPKATATVEAVAAPPISIRTPMPKAVQSDFGSARLRYKYSAPARGKDVVISA